MKKILSLFTFEFLFIIFVFLLLPSLVILQGQGQSHDYGSDSLPLSQGTQYQFQIDNSFPTKYLKLSLKNFRPQSNYQLFIKLNSQTITIPASSISSSQDLRLKIEPPSPQVNVTLSSNFPEGLFLVSDNQQIMYQTTIVYPSFTSRFQANLNHQLIHLSQMTPIYSIAYLTILVFFNIYLAIKLLK